MIRFLLLLITSLSCILSAEIGKDQIAQINQGLHVPYGKALQICQEKGFRYFVFKNISYSDDKGQTLKFERNINDEKGLLISEAIELNLIPSFGKQLIKFEILCFNETPEDPLVIDVKETYDFIAMLENQEVAPHAGLNQVKEINNFKELELEIAKAKGPIYLDCYSANCPPCKMLSPKFDQYSIDLASKGTFLKVNINAVPEINPVYGVQAIPTLIVFKDQKEKTRKSGLPEILKYFESLKD